MKAVIMAGGMGTRLRPVTGDRPKPMADILGKPIMEHILLHLKDCGFDEICAAVKYRAEDIMDCFGEGERLGLHLEYRVETEPLGTAGAVKNCRDFYGDEDFLVISADAACDFRLDELMRAHRESGAAVTIALHRNSDPLRYGLAVQDSEGFVRAFIEKPDWPHVVTDLVNTGIYVISPRVMELVPVGESDFGRDIFPELLRRGEKILGLEMAGYWRDMGTPADYYRCCADAWEGIWRLPEHLPLMREVAERSEVGGREKSLSPSRFATAPSSEGALWDCSELLVPVSDRAGVMGILSLELMDLGADYSRGIRLRLPRFDISIAPSAERAALRVAVRGDDMEAARMLELARDMVEKIDKGAPD